MFCAHDNVTKEQLPSPYLTDRLSHKGTVEGAVNIVPTLNTKTLRWQTSSALQHPASTRPTPRQLENILPFSHTFAATASIGIVPRTSRTKSPRRTSQPAAATVRPSRPAACEPQRRRERQSILSLAEWQLTCLAKSDIGLKPNGRRPIRINGDTPRTSTQKARLANASIG